MSSGSPNHFRSDKMLPVLTSHYIELSLSLALDGTPLAHAKQPKALGDRRDVGFSNPSTMTNDDTMLCKRVVTKDRRYITQITCYEKGSETDQGNDKDKKPLRLPVYAKQTNGGTLASLFNFARQGTRLTLYINPTSTLLFPLFFTPNTVLSKSNIV